MACVLDLSCIHTHMHTCTVHSFYRIDAVNNELYLRTELEKGTRDGMNKWHFAAEKKSKPFTINSYFDGFYKIYTVKQMV